jgi:putative ABC transport system permease protein
VIQEPDAGFNPFQMAPRLMMNTADVAKPAPCSPAAASPGAISSPERCSSWRIMKVAAAEARPEHRWIGLEQDDSALGKSLERSQQFLLLSALLTLLLAVAVAVAMSHYCRSRYDLVPSSRRWAPGGRSCAS